LIHGPTLRCRLEQLLTAAKDTCLARLNRTHDTEVAELKKKLDSHNWDEMKALARRHRDKSELARHDSFSRDSFGPNSKNPYSLWARFSNYLNRT